MTRLRPVLGLLAGTLILLSSLAHSFPGWQGIRTQLTGAGVQSAEVLDMVRIGWLWGGAVMVALGAIAVWTFLRRLRDQPVSTVPAGMIGVLYLVFGAWATAASGGQLFFGAVFLLPGVLLLLASLPARGA